jgi:hypothetical protein
LVLAFLDYFAKIDNAVAIILTSTITSQTDFTHKFIASAPPKNSKNCSEIKCDFGGEIIAKTNR